MKFEFDDGLTEQERKNRNRCLRGMGYVTIGVLLIVLSLFLQGLIFGRTDFFYIGGF